MVAESPSAARYIRRKRPALASFSAWFFAALRSPCCDDCPAWLMRSAAQHVVSLVAFITWFIAEINHEGSPAFFGGHTSQVLLYALLSLCLVGLGYWWRQSRWPEFGAPTFQVGLIGFLMSIFPATWRGFFYDYDWHGNVERSQWVAPVMALLAAVSLGVGLGRSRTLPVQWRWVWGSSLALVAGLVAWRVYGWGLASRPEAYGEPNHLHWLCMLAFFVFSLVLIQVGVHERSASMVNLGIGFVGLVMLWSAESPLASAPALSVLTRVVVPVTRSFTKTSWRPLLSPATRSDAAE